MVNTLSNLQKRAVAYSGRADIGDVPPLYAEQRAAAQQAAEQALMGGGGAPSGGGGGVPLDFGGGGGGAVGGSADVGLPGTTGNPVMDQALAEGYRRQIRDNQADPREAPGRDAQNPDVEAFLDEYFGFLKNPAVLGVSAPFVGTFASTLGPYFGATDIPEPAPLGPVSIVQQLLGGGGGGTDIGRDFTPGEFLGPSIADTTQADLEAAQRAVEAELGSVPGLGTQAPTRERERQRGDRGGGQSDAGGSGGGLCFAEGTKILMADMTEKPIEEIRLGDMVMGFHEVGPPEPARVIGVYAHLDKAVMRINGDTLVTGKHRFFADVRGNGAYEFIAAEDLAPGHRLMGIEGDVIEIERVENAGELRNVCNFTVEGLHTYFANGYRVHNIKHMGGPIVAPEEGGEVDETLLDGEFVLNPQATKMLGEDFLTRANHMARLASRK